MIVGALLANIVEAGTGVSPSPKTWTSQPSRSRLARAEIGRLVEEVATNLADLSDAKRQQLAESTGAPGPPCPTRSAKTAPSATKPSGSPSAPWSPQR
jgi:hypothetical protein